MRPVITVPLRSADVSELVCGHDIVLPGGCFDARGHITHPWLPELHARLGEMVAIEMPILGIFLDHQILAAAGGGEKGPMTVKAVSGLSRGARPPLSGRYPVPSRPSGSVARSVSNSTRRLSRRAWGTRSPDTAGTATS